MWHRGLTGPTIRAIAAKWRAAAAISCGSMVRGEGGGDGEETLKAE